MLVRRGAGRWEQPPVQQYANEAELQALIAESPEVVGDIERRPVVTLRELALPDAGFLDVLVVHLDGELTLVEAKLNRNPEIRRAVVGQLLGYAGGLWRLSYDRLDALVHEREGKPLADLALAAAASEPFDADAFRRAVSRNLHDGTFRLVFAVDQITEDLKRAVEYLNAHTIDGTEVVVLELGYAKVGDVEILLPRSFGEEAVRTKRASRSRQRWDESSLFATLEEHATPEEVEAVRRLYEWAQPRAHHLYWGDGKTPSVTMAFEGPEGMVQPCTVYVAGISHGVAVNFDWVRRRPPQALEALLDRLQILPTIARARSEILAKDYAKRPTVPLTELTGNRMTVLIEAFEALLTHPPDPDRHD
jgi:hypothetical protein